MASGVLESAGPVMVWIIVLGFVFTECAFIVGLFLPGDSLLFAAGVVLAEHDGEGRPHGHRAAGRPGAEPREPRQGT